MTLTLYALGCLAFGLWWAATPTEEPTGPYRTRHAWDIDPGLAIIKEIQP